MSASSPAYSLASLALGGRGLRLEAAEIIHGNRTIHGPTQEEISQMDINAVRGDPNVDTIAEVHKYNDTDSYPLVRFIGLSVRLD